ncbi:hypothetical protein [Agrobacterium tumefaciens]|uniref:hypothetical protein n=1 Tax=Agrobacterium tumefaciens TaxID=358 RepID=UPI001F380187|nr:hypothetical protein [Agrobacterium tumefaciens]
MTFFIGEKRSAFSCADKSKNGAHHGPPHYEESDMHAIFAARTIIENQQPRTRREAIQQEEKFYADMAQASRLWRLFSALISMMRAKSGQSVKESDQGGDSAGCDNAQAKGQLPALAFSAGDGNGARAAMCRSVHARAPDEKLNRPMPC